MTGGAVEPEVKSIFAIVSPLTAPARSATAAVGETVARSEKRVVWRPASGSRATTTSTESDTTASIARR